MEKKIEFNEAVKMAKSSNEAFNKCEEYGNAWLFYNGDAPESDGGGNCIVVMFDGSVRHAHKYFFSSDATESVGDPFDI